MNCSQAAGCPKLQTPSMKELAGLLVPFRDHRPVLDPMPPRVPHFLIQVRIWTRLDFIRVKCPEGTVQPVKIIIARIDDRLYDIVVLHLLGRWERDLAE